jgi:hypothetical protein
MARFNVGQTLETRAPTIVVDQGLAPGRHRFQVVVFDEAGHRSKPDTVAVEIQPAPLRGG